MGKRLLVSDGTRERELQLVGRLVVGRDPACDISHDHSLLSRRHAEFVTAGESVTVRDLGSRNGVFVNGARTAERTLNPGDVVQIGPLRARYVADRAPVSATPEHLDADRTALLNAPTPSAGPSSAPPPSAPAAAASAFEDDDEAITRLIHPPPPDHVAVRSPAFEADPDEEGTRFIRGPIQTAARSTSVAVLPVEASRPDAAGVTSSPAPAPMTAFVYLQLAMFAALILVAAALPPILGIGTSAPGASASGLLRWLAAPAAVAAVGTYLVGSAINKRFAHSSASGRTRT